MGVPWGDGRDGALGGEIEEKAKPRYSFAVQKGGTGDSTVMYKEAMVRPCHGLPPRVILASMVLPQLESESMSEA